MSIKNLSKLLSMICDPAKREQLFEFKMIIVCTSKSVNKIAEEKEERFYQVLSEIEVDENGYANAALDQFKLYITVFEVQEEQQSQGTVFFHVVSLDEEIERELEQKEAAQFLKSGVIEIE